LYCYCFAVHVCIRGGSLFYVGRQFIQNRYLKITILLSYKCDTWIQTKFGVLCTSHLNFAWAFASAHELPLNSSQKTRLTVSFVSNHVNFFRIFIPDLFFLPLITWSVLYSRVRRLKRSVKRNKQTSKLTIIKKQNENLYNVLLSLPNRTSSPPQPRRRCVHMIIIIVIRNVYNGDRKTR